MNIKEAIKQSKCSTTRIMGFEIVAAEEMLMPDERVLYATTAKVKVISGAISPRLSTDQKAKAGVVVVTDRRMYFCRSSIMGQAEQLNLHDINSMEQKSRIMNGILRITGNTIAFEMEIFAFQLNELINTINTAKQNQNSPAPVHCAESNSLSDLEKLAELRDKGIITEDEFAAKKKQILGL